MVGLVIPFELYPRYAFWVELTQRVATRSWGIGREQVMYE